MIRVHTSMSRHGLASFLVIILFSIFLLHPDRDLGLTKLNQLPIEVERRLSWWNGKDTPEEVKCQAHRDSLISEHPIPNIAHFILLAKEGEETELSFARFLAIKSALVRMNATEIKVHCYSLNVHNIWWTQISSHVTLVVHDRYELLGANGWPVHTFSLPHQADFLRLDIEVGPAWRSSSRDARILKTIRCLLNGCNLATTILKVMKLKEVDLL